MILRPERASPPIGGPARRLALVGAAWRFVWGAPSLWLLGAVSVAVNVAMSFELTRIPIGEWDELASPSIVEQVADGFVFAAIAAIAVAIGLRAGLVSRSPLRYRPTDGANELLIRALPALIAWTAITTSFWAALSSAPPVALVFGLAVGVPASFVVPAILDEGSLRDGVASAFGLLRGRWIDVLLIGVVPAVAVSAGGGIVTVMLADFLSAQTLATMWLVWTSTTGSIGFLWSESMRVFIYRDAREFGPRQPRT